jgi:hypothetical protein
LLLDGDVSLGALLLRDWTAAKDPRRSCWRRCSLASRMAPLSASTAKCPDHHRLGHVLLPKEIQSACKRALGSDSNLEFGPFAKNGKRVLFVLLVARRHPKRANSCCWMVVSAWCSLAARLDCCQGPKKTLCFKDGTIVGVGRHCRVVDRHVPRSSSPRPRSLAQGDSVRVQASSGGDFGPSAVVRECLLVVDDPSELLVVVDGVSPVVSCCDGCQRTQAQLVLPPPARSLASTTSSTVASVGVRRHGRVVVDRECTICCHWWSTPQASELLG